MGDRKRTQYKVGDLYTTDGKDIWRVTEFKPEPWVSMERVDAQDVAKSGGISAFSKFIKLIPEKRKYERKQSAEATQ